MSTDYQLIEDNSGFVNFPNHRNQENKTLVYLVSFEPKVKKSLLSNVNLILPGDFVSDDLMDRDFNSNLIKNLISQDIYNSTYFPNSESTDLESLMSINMLSIICIGWSVYSFEINGRQWKATFRDLTEEGKKLYYSLKKLHNSKEVRILTFTNI